MKNVVSSALVILFAVFPAFAQNIEEIKEHEAKVEEVIFDSKEMGQKRQVLIQTPMNYNVRDFTYYNVIYVFDAQMRPFFDYTSGIVNLMGAGDREFIVVGIKATWIKEKMYGRNHDLVPSDTRMRLGPKSGGNAEAFLSFVKNEVMPYVESNYRTMPHNVAVGHSLSASFLLYTMIHEPDLFNNYIAVSPNLAYDDQRLVRDLRNFDPEQFSSPTYLYMSHADEHKAWPDWEKANKNAYALLRDT
ncbi:MAG: alpha/beta hydrolase-fold protein, partial [Balneolaceae bacterium]|nr:alpha/beta hydrolase-fold protein [Balneolaceae bacterium]